MGRHRQPVLELWTVHRTSTHTVEERMTLEVTLSRDEMETIAHALAQAADPTDLQKHLRTWFRMLIEIDVDMQKHYDEAK